MVGVGGRVQAWETSLRLACMNMGMDKVDGHNGMELMASMKGTWTLASNQRRKRAYLACIVQALKARLIAHVKEGLAHTQDED